VLAGCKVDASVEVRVKDDGSGVVRLTVVADAEAVRAVESGGVALEQAVRLSDLEGAGWQVEPWVRAEDGSATLVLVNRFANVSEVAQILADISGTEGPLRSVRASRERGLLSTEYQVKGRADLLNVKTGVPADEELLQSLAAQGVDVNVIDQQLLAQVKSSFALQVVVRLPGQKAKTFDAVPEKVVAINATSSVRNDQRVIFLIVAVGFALLAVIMWIRGGRRRRRPRGPAPRGQGRGPAPAPVPRRVPSRGGAPPPPRRPPRPQGRSPGAPRGPQDWRS